MTPLRAVMSPRSGNGRPDTQYQSVLLDVQTWSVYDS
jgi:hypothetical protein